MYSLARPCAEAGQNGKNSLTVIYILRLFTPDDGIYIYIASTHAGGAYKSHFLYINSNPVVWHGDLDS